MKPTKDQEIPGLPNSAEFMRTVADRVQTERAKKDMDDADDLIANLLEKCGARARDGHYDIEIINVQWRNIVQPLSAGARKTVIETLSDLGYTVSSRDHEFIVSWAR